MDDCCAPRTPRDYDRAFNDRFARDLARDYRRKGLTAQEQRIVDFAGTVGLDGVTVLEVGGGIGAIQLELLGRGAARTTNLELSPAYEAEAMRLLDEAGLRERSNRMLGVDLAVADDDLIEPADIVVLHRVVCCYPDYDRLLAAAARHAMRAVVFTHPPRTLLSRVGVRLANTFERMIRSDYRAFVHPPEAMLSVLDRYGFTPTYRRREGFWQVVGATRDRAAQ